MCGMAGYISSGKHLNPHRLEDALENIKHRGPDGSGFSYYSKGLYDIGIGHNRLCILDLSERSNQPMKIDQDKYSLIYNGEIYNYIELRRELISLGEVFRTTSDTEVVIRAWKRWGIHSLQKLNGMFAFGLFDLESNLLFLARDAYGIKPLYYSLDKNSFAFASTPDSLCKLVNKVSPNHQKVYEYITMGIYDNSEQTFFESISSLQPGHIIEINFSSKNLRFKKIRWLQEVVPESVSDDFETSAKKVSSLLQRSIELHMRSDVPVAIALSGGIDSSGLVGMARLQYTRKEIYTFSFESPGFEKDESRWSRLVSNSLNTIHNAVKVETPGISDIYRVVIEQGEPTNSSSVIAQSQLYREVSAAGFKVILDGQGADELFAGYYGYVEFRLRSLISKGHFRAALNLLKRWRNISLSNTMFQATSLLAATYLPPAFSRYGAKYVDRNPFPKWINRAECIGNNIHMGIPQLIGYPVYEAYSSNYLQQHLRQSLFGGDLQRLLRQGDRSSMAHSLESRFPYLDKSLVGYVNNLPENYLLSQDGLTKYVLRKALTSIVPLEILHRKDKVGFETPESSWINQFDYKDESFRAGLSLFPWLDFGVLLSKSNKVSNRLKWRLLNLSVWSNVFFKPNL